MRVGECAQWAALLAVMAAVRSTLPKRDKRFSGGVCLEPLCQITPIPRRFFVGGKKNMPRLVRRHHMDPPGSNRTAIIPAANVRSLIGT